MLTKLLAVGALAAGTALLFGLAHAAPPPSEFEEVEMHVEQNATDGDTEVVITGVASDEGLKRLRVRSPTGRQLVLMQNSKRMQGLREFAFESPESVDPEQSLQLNLGAGATSFAVPAALLVPEGEYQVGVATIGDNGNVVFVELNFTTAAAP